MGVCLNSSSRTVVFVATLRGSSMMEAIWRASGSCDFIAGEGAAAAPPDDAALCRQPRQGPAYRGPGNAVLAYEGRLAG